MKKIISSVLVIVGAITITFSCKKAENKPSSPSKTNNQIFDLRSDKSFNETFQLEVTDNSNKKLNTTKIIEITNLKDEEARKIAYSLLSTNEKIDFWEYVIQHHIDNDGFNSSQKQLLTALKNLTTTNTFFTNQNLRTLYMTQFAPLIKVQFNNAGITDYHMASVFGDGRLDYIEPIVLVGNDTKNCNCNKSIYIFTTCGNNCSTGIQCSETVNCGFLWSYICDGLCGKYMTK